MRSARFRAGHWLLRAGIWVMPRGRVKAELISLLDQWTTHVHQTIDSAILHTALPEGG